MWNCCKGYIKLLYGNVVKKEALLIFNGTTGKYNTMPALPNGSERNLKKYNRICWHLNIQHLLHLIPVHAADGQFIFCNFDSIAGEGFNFIYCNNE